MLNPYYCAVIQKTANEILAREQKFVAKKLIHRSKVAPLSQEEVLEVVNLICS